MGGTEEAEAHMGMAGRSGKRSLRSRLSGGGAIRARCCSIRASLWMSSIFLGPSTFLRACQPCFSLKSMMSYIAVEAVFRHRRTSCVHNKALERLPSQTPVHLKPCKSSAKPLCCAMKLKGLAEAESQTCVLPES